MDVTAIANALVEALQRSGQSQIASINQSQQLQFQANQNAANASGLLYSTKPGWQNAQFAADTTLPSLAKVNESVASGTVSAKNSLKAALDKVAELNKATTELNAL